MFALDSFSRVYLPNMCYFINRSYVEGERKKREELGIDIEAVPLQLEDNTELAEEGTYTAFNFRINLLFRFCFWVFNVLIVVKPMEAVIPDFGRQNPLIF